MSPALLHAMDFDENTFPLSGIDEDQNLSFFARIFCV